MILSTKCSLKFGNQGKLNSLSTVMNEHLAVTQQFIDILWELPKPAAMPPKEITDQVQTWLSARMKQVAAKQASAIVRGTKAKTQRRQWKISQLHKQGIQSSKLQKLTAKAILSKPLVSSLAAELDDRFVKVDLANSTSFDGWLTLTCLGNKLKLQLPFKKTKHFLKLESQGAMLKGCRLAKSTVSFNFELPDQPKKTSGTTIGVDIGYLDAWVASDGQKAMTDKHHWTLGKIIDKLSRKTKGSKGFQRAEAHRTNYINWSINQLNLDEVAILRLENIRQMRTGKRTNRKLSHWVYADLFRKLETVANRQGVLVERIPQAFTSQRCSACGWTRKANRRGKVFCCKNCGFTCDADMNAALNISLDLPSIWQERQQRKNLIGFYWLVTAKPNGSTGVGQECIVPDVVGAKNK